MYEKLYDKILHAHLYDKRMNNKLRFQYDSVKIVEVKFHFWDHPAPITIPD